MTDQMATVARTLRDWVQAEARPLQKIEIQVVRVLHDVGNALLVALLPLTASARPSPFPGWSISRMSGSYKTRGLIASLASHRRMRAMRPASLARPGM